MPTKNKCDKCYDDLYILHGCCSGRECGCMGQPVSMSNCVACNPLGDKEPAGNAKYYAELVEYVFVSEDALNV